MIINGQSLLRAKPIEGMETEKIRFQGTSYGLSEAGYDIRIKQDVTFIKDAFGDRVTVREPDGTEETFFGSFCLASSIEAFDMPRNLVGVVHDKSTWARKALSVFNTVIEPGWKGKCLTLELVFHGSGVLHIPAGAGIAQVLFHSLVEEGDYGDGKYQNAHDRPQPALE